LIARALSVAPLLAGCTVWNATDACDVAPQESRVNLFADRLEFPSSNRAAAEISSGRIVVVYTAAEMDGLDVTAAEVRFAMIDPRDGTRSTLCTGFEEEIVVSDLERLASGASVVAVDWPEGEGRDAVALLGWSETTKDGESRARVLPIDASGCPVPLASEPFAPVYEDRTGAVEGLSLVWSDTRRAVFAVFHDAERRVRGAWIDSVGSAVDASTLGTEARILGQVASAVDDEGRVALAWRYWDDRMIVNDEQGIRALLLDAEGLPRPGALAGGAAPFRVNEAGDYYVYGSNSPFGVSVATEGTRIAFAWEGGDDPKLLLRARIREIDAADGVPLAIAGASDGGPAYADPQDGATTASASLAYLPDGSLLALWESDARSGTVGRLFGPDGDRRFSGVGCDERPFAVGVRADDFPGTSAPLLVGDRLWVFHAAAPTDDPVPSGVMGWRVALADLWPGE